MFDRQRITLFETRSIMLFSAWTLCAAGAAFAQSTATPAEPSTEQEISALFASADKNADGSLNREEFNTLPGLSEQFAQIDANKDGAISLAEFTNAMKAR